MKKQILFLACIFLPVLSSAQVFYTGYWNGTSIDTNVWTNQQASWMANLALHNSYLGDDGSTNNPTMVTYNHPPTADYSVQIPSLCLGVAYSEVIYLRSQSVSYQGYMVQFNVSADDTAEIRLTANGSYLAYAGGLSCGNTITATIVGSQITVAASGTTVISTSDTTWTSGTVGIGTYHSTVYGISRVTLSYAGSNGPSVPTGLAATAPTAGRTSLTWNPSTGPNGISYFITRNGSYAGISSSTTFIDYSVAPATAYSYAVSSVDTTTGAGSVPSSPASVTTLGPARSAPYTGGPIGFSATWGSGPEKIGLANGALSFNIPLPKLQQYSRGPGFQFTASWNSLIWQNNGNPTSSASSTNLVGLDTGYGLGWLFQIGAVYPVLSGSTVVRWELQDSAGVIHQLMPVTGSSTKFKSNDSSYMVWDLSTQTLTFRDGSYWIFNCISYGTEPDAGTYYPTTLYDYNGNFITVTYQAGSTAPQTNTSGRISFIQDSATKYIWQYTTINNQPHVSLVYHYQTTGQQFNDAQFTYTTADGSHGVTSPFNGDNWPGTQTAVLLTSIGFTGAPGKYQFDYIGFSGGVLAGPTTGEISKVTLPYKGYFRYDYVVYTSSGNVQNREISARHMSADTSTEQHYQFYHPGFDTGQPGHAWTTLVDPVGNQKVWYFIQNSANGWDNGLSNRMETYQGTSSILRAVNTVWTQDTFSSTSITNPRPCATTTILQDGQTQSTTETDIDANGNVTAVREYAFGRSSNNGAPASSACTSAGSGNPAGSLYRTTTASYVNNGAYPSKNILNRPAEVKVCNGAAGCTGAAILADTQFSYDSVFVDGNSNAVGGDCNYQVTNVTGPQHDSTNYGSSYCTRGNPTKVIKNGVITTILYDSAGNVVKAFDGQYNQTSSATYNYSSNNLLSSATSLGNSTSIFYNNDLTVQQTTGSYSDTVSWTYNNSYRTQKVTNPDNTVVTYGYSDMNSSNGQLGQAWSYPYVQTVTSPGGKVSYTQLDGFGRPILSAKKETSTQWIVTLTQYGACSCSASGKAVSTSRPFHSPDSGGAPTGLAVSGESIYWTTTSSDGLGRPVSVTLPAPATSGLITGTNSNQTAYSYGTENDTVNGATWLGATTTVTSPTGKPKRYLYDAFGNLLRVDELNTANNGNFSTSNLIETARYTYDAAGHMTQVQMSYQTNGTFKQTRTFAYYAYDGTPKSGHLYTSTTPEKGTVTYYYNSNGQLDHKTDAKNQTLYYVYDSNYNVQYIDSPPGNHLASFAIGPGGRLGAHSANGFTYTYTYDIMGRVTNESLTIANFSTSGAAPPQPTTVNAVYGYDTDGVMNSITYPVAPQYYYYTATATYTLDGLGRQVSLNKGDILFGGSNVNTINNGTYNAAGQLVSWQEGYYGTPGNVSTWINSQQTRTFDVARGWMTGLSSTYYYYGTNSLLNMQYGYNGDGQVTTVTDAVNPGQGVTSYTYDNLNCLASATTPNWNMAWTYDEFRNRLTQTGSAASGQPAVPTSSLTYDPATNRITDGSYIYNGAQVNGAGPYLSYDNNGNLTRMPTGPVPQNPAYTPSLYATYDSFDRLTQLTQTYNGPATFTSYSYDAMGRRASKMGSSTGTYYFYGMNGQLLMEYPVNVCGITDANSNCWQTPTPNANLTFYYYFAGQRVGSWTDRVGTQRYTTANGGSYEHHYPYGEEITATAGDTFKYAQLYRDSDSGLDYALNRYYASSIGRFLTPDPYQATATSPTDSSSPQSWNRYLYVANNPVNYLDPDGMKLLDPICNWDPEEMTCYYPGPGPDPRPEPGPSKPDPVNCGQQIKKFGISLVSDAGVLGLTNYFEFSADADQNGDVSPTATAVWIGIDWAFKNQTNLSPADKLKFFGNNGAPSTFQGYVKRGSQVWNKKGRLKPKFQKRLNGILAGSADSAQCDGLINAIGVGADVLSGAQADNVGAALQFASGGKVPGHGPGVQEQVTANWGPFTFFQPIFP